MVGEKKYKPEMCDIVVDLFSKGYTQEEACAFLGVTPKTMIEWRKEGGPSYHPEFAEAFKLAKTLQAAWWLAYGRSNLENTGFNTALYKLFMSNLFGFDDREKRERALDERAARVEKAMREHGLMPPEDDFD